GFHYDTGLPRAALKEVLLEAARMKLRVSCIFAEVAALFEEVHRKVPIDNLRWAWGHIAVLTEDDVLRARDLGLVVVTHTNRHIRKMGSQHLQRLGPENQDQIVPLRRLMDAGVPISLATDNVPPSLFYPIHHAVARRDETTGEVVAPGQKLSREEALHCATWGGAYLAGREADLGSLEPGKKADIAILNDDLMTMPEDGIPGLHADTVIVDGKIVLERS
ncbi:MAG: amidohydrolase family protein, partial [Arenicellales bacterium]